MKERKPYKKNSSLTRLPSHNDRSSFHVSEGIFGWSQKEKLFFASTALRQNVLTSTFFPLLLADEWWDLVKNLLD